MKPCVDASDGKTKQRTSISIHFSIIKFAADSVLVEGSNAYHNPVLKSCKATASSTIQRLLPFPDLRDHIPDSHSNTAIFFPSRRSTSRASWAGFGSIDVKASREFQIRSAATGYDNRVMKEPMRVNTALLDNDATVISFVAERST
jgi:hypothetical protein